MRRKISNILDYDDKPDRDDEDTEDDENEDEEEVDVSDLSDANSETNDQDSSQISEEELSDEDETIEDKPSRNSLAFIVAILLLNSSQLFLHKQNIVEKESEIQLNLAQVDELDLRYPQLLSSKEMRIIKTRLAIMRREVSILMLLGKSKDVKCKSDPTYCIGQTIVNVTQVQYGYIDASNPRIKSNDIEQTLTGSLDGNKHAVMIDSLEKLPGSQVMNLFQFIDKDETHKRRGMLLFVVYTGVDGRGSERLVNLRDAEIAEKILLDKWSPSIPMDSLTSVISRICGSIVKVY